MQAHQKLWLCISVCYVLLMGLIGEFLNLIDTETLDELLRDVAEIKKRLDFLFVHSYPVNQDVLFPVGVAFDWSRKINRLLITARNEIQRDRDGLETLLKKKRTKFGQDLNLFTNQVEDLKQDGATMEMSGTIKDVSKMKKKIDVLEATETKLTEEAGEYLKRKRASIAYMKSTVV